MSLRLIDLPQELLLQIADWLVKEEQDANPDEDEGKTIAKFTCEYEGPGAYAMPIENEEHDNIWRENATKDTLDKPSAQEQKSPYKNDGHSSKVTASAEQNIHSLSRACTSLYEILSPYLFRSITLRNTQKSGAAVQYLCSTYQTVYVKTLHFKGTAFRKKEKDFRNFEGVFPPEVKTILSNLSELPSLETLIVDFDFHPNEEEGYDCWSEVLINLTADEYDEHERDIEIAEGDKGWRALVRKTFEAISAQNSDSVRELVIKDCPIRTNSVLGSEQLNKWLEKLESFKFEIYGADSGTGWKTNTAPCFQRYINNLDQYFFNALANVTHLAILGHKEAAIGQTEYHEALIPLREEHAPKLKELELGYYFIQEDLVNFLVAHSSTLEHLIFHHCFFPVPFADTFIPNDPDQSDDSEWTWNTWFHSYASQKPRALQRVTFKPYNATIIPEGKKFLDERKAEGRAYRVFPYGEIENEYGMLFEGEECNLNRARKEWDQEGWYELTEVMKSNRERLTEH